MRRERTTGNMVWIGLLGFCLFVCVVMDGLCLYLLVIQWVPPRQMLKLLLICSGLTATSFQLLRRRLYISGSDKFF